MTPKIYQSTWLSIIKHNKARLIVYWPWQSPLLPPPPRLIKSNGFAVFVASQLFRFYYFHSLLAYFANEHIIETRSIRISS